jgi:DNA invertase Pin-like site-specific DNA recombinase
MAKYVTYLRLSRESRGGRNYGLDAQRRDLDLFLGQLCPEVDGCLEIASYIEIQSGANDARPELAKAIDHAKREKAELLVAKLDRLSRRVSFIAGLLEDRRLSFRVANMPHADKFQLHIYAALSEQEREFIIARTKAGLAAAQSRGVKLGGIRPNTITRNDAAKTKAAAEAERLRPLLAALQTNGASLRQMAEALAAAGTVTRNGKPLSPSTVRLRLERLGLLAAA